MKTVLDEGVPADIVPPLQNLGADIEPFRSEWRGLTNGLSAQFAPAEIGDRRVAYQPA